MYKETAIFREIRAAEADSIILRQFNEDKNTAVLTKTEGDRSRTSSGASGR